MTQGDAKRAFIEEGALGGVIEAYGPDDRPALDQAWNEWTDMLAKTGEISQRQYDAWETPRFSDRDKLDSLRAYHRNVWPG